MHCHDRHSDIPDELIGRILGVPETWLPGERLLEELKKNGCDAFTVTNHNNARSCYELQDKGFDILTAAEFSCMVPDYDIGIHVLAYGFTPEQEVRLNKLRKNIYSFQEYTHRENIPTIWAHPLYHYAVKRMPEDSFFRKMLLLFERFEAFNGQRDTWQNMLVKEWIKQTDEEMIDGYAREFDIEPDRYCHQPYRKVLTGGSDSHMGIFAGMTGCRLYIPDLQERVKTENASGLALEALRTGDIAPFGGHQNSEKLTLAFLNYACQIALNYKDPGLMRLVLHKGDLNDKLIALGASNIFSEVQKHKVTMSFIKMFHNCMMGKSPSGYKRYLLPSAYKPIFDEVSGIAQVHQSPGNRLVEDYYEAVLRINQYLNGILSGRIEEKIYKSFLKEKGDESFSLDDFISGLELPVDIRQYIESNDLHGINVAKLLDGLSFPFFSSLFILAAHFTSAKALYNTRPFLKHFSKQLGRYEHPERILWLTDTYEDKNGVSMFLQEMHRQVEKRNLPVDILVCSHTIQPDKHLKVIKPVGEFSLPAYQEQPFHVPNMVELHNLFLEGEYDRIVCSTEGFMGICSLYLKHAYQVEATFYMHTDWLMFARKVLGIKGHNLSRVRRFLRFFYQSFDRVLVLNSDHKNWLTGRHMNLQPEQVFQTVHWANPAFYPRPVDKTNVFGVPADRPVLLYVGRISHEKGVMELPELYHYLQEKDGTIEMVIVGKGPALTELREALPEAIYMDWVPQDKLPEIYTSADLLVLPSRFDTFCNVVLESLSCGLPVVAYNCKGPKDILVDGTCGFLTDSKQEMAIKTAEYIHIQNKISYREAAVQRAKQYNAGTIIAGLMESIGMTYE
ncbi:MAG: glycosyltransferase [Tannerellaceae bacterium]|nr:glycosyltransferase [Tannerellaceae bacterium]